MLVPSETGEKVIGGHSLAAVKILFVTANLLWDNCCFYDFLFVTAGCRYMGDPMD